MPSLREECVLMTAPVEEVVASDEARDERVSHVFCVGCIRIRKPGRYRAMCGTLAWCRGQIFKAFLPDDCVVCMDLGSQLRCPNGHQL